MRDAGCGMRSYATASRIIFQNLYIVVDALRNSLNNSTDHLVVRAVMRLLRAYQRTIAVNCDRAEAFTTFRL